VAVFRPGFVIGRETIPARRAPLSAVQIGSLSLEGASCLVLSDDATGRVGPFLGTDVLDYFAWDLDAGGAGLTLTQVIPALAREMRPTPVKP
jgi:hypothetical protein